MIMNNSRATLEDFTMLSVLGKGNFAKVVLVRHNLSQKTFAMKLIPKKNVSAKKQESFVQIERNVLVQVKHPFIIRMFYSFQNATKLFFVLQYCQGGELYRQINKKLKIPEYNIKFYAAQIILALQHLHERNIVYRDLKPQNVLIDEKGYIRLTDFGLSNMEQDVIATRGTFEYLAPEVLNNQLSGKAVDWWGLGTLLFEMATGEPPFYDSQRSEISYKIRYSKPAFPKHVSSELRSLIQKLLNKNPDQRLGSKGVTCVKNHPWFQNMDWKKLLRKQLLPPYIPSISSDSDTSNFDSEFTACEVDSELNENRSDQEEFQHFEDFSFENNIQIDQVHGRDSDLDSYTEFSPEFEMQITSVIGDASEGLF